MATLDSTDSSDTRTSEQDHPEAHDLKRVLGEIERDLILTALQESHGNKAKAARALGITERFMGLRVKRLGIDWARACAPAGSSRRARSRAPPAVLPTCYGTSSRTTVLGVSVAVKKYPPLPLG